MVNLISPPSDNIGGLELCFFTEWENIDFSQFPQLAGVKLAGDIVLKSGAKWYQLVYTRDTADYDLSVKTDRNGDIYAHIQKGIFPKDTPDLASALADMKRRRFALLFKDRNGYLCFCSTTDSWLDFTYKLSKGNNPQDRNGYSFTFSGESTFPAFYYSGNIDVSELGLIEPQPIGGGGSGAPVLIKNGSGATIATVLPGQTFVITSGFSFGFNII